MKRLWRFLKLQAILWHSDKWTNWYRFRLKTDPEGCKEEVREHLSKMELANLVGVRRQMLADPENHLARGWRVVPGGGTYPFSWTRKDRL